MIFRYFLIGGMLTTLTLFFITLVVCHPKFVALKQPNSPFLNRHQALALCLFSGLFINFFTIYYAAFLIADPAAEVQRIIHQYHTEPLGWNLGATAIGWNLDVMHYQYRHYGVDSWWPMYKAIEFIRQNPDGMIYQTVFFDQGIKFQYPTSVLLFLDFIQRLTHFSWGKVIVALNLISFVLLPMLAWVFCKLYYISSQQLDSIKKLAVKDKLIGMILTILCTFIFYPIILSDYLGQIQTIIVFLATLAFLTFSQKKILGHRYFIGHLH